MFKKFTFAFVFCFSMIASQSVLSMSASGESEKSNIWKAAFDGELERVHYLLQQGVNVDEVSDSFCRLTPLMRAISGGHLKVVKYLVENGKVDIHAKSINNCSPLYYAFRECHIKIVKYLVKKGASFSYEYHRNTRNIAFNKEDIDIYKEAVWHALLVVIPDKNDFYDSDNYNEIDELNRIEVAQYIFNEARKANIFMKKSFYSILLRRLSYDAKKMKDFIVVAIAHRNANKFRYKKGIKESLLQEEKDLKQRITFLVSKKFLLNFKDEFSMKIPLCALLKNEAADSVKRLDACIKEKQNKRDVLIGKIAVKKSSSPGYFTKRSLFYSVYGDIEKELKDLQDKKQGVEKRQQVMSSKKQKIQRMFKLYK